MPNVKILVLSHPLGGLRGNAQHSSMARLPISDNLTFLTSSHGCGTIKRNLRFLKGWVTLSANFR